jgi:hypothetical protein
MYFSMCVLQLILSALTVSSRDGASFLTAVINFFTECQHFNASFTDQCEKLSKFQKCLEAKSSLFTDLLLNEEYYEV